MDKLIDLAVSAKGTSTITKSKQPLMYKIMSALQQNTGNKLVSLLDIIVNATILGVNVKQLITEVNLNCHEYYAKY